MQAEQYEKQALRTLGNQFHADKVEPMELDAILKDVIEVGDLLDKCKKSLFYGKPAPEDDLDTLFKTGKDMNQWANYPSNKQLVHAILGIIGEAAELAELLEKILDGTRVDPDRIIDELGDTQWFVAVGANATGRDLQTAMKLNLEKLRERFPEKFDPDRAANPDKQAEQGVFQAV